MTNIADRDYHSEIKFRTSRSGGSGGQHANKVETRVELIFNIEASQLLSELEKFRIKKKLEHKLDSEGNLHLIAEDSRSQTKNKEIVYKRFLETLSTAVLVPKKRKPTRKSRAAKEANLKRKRIRSEAKQRRKKPNLGSD